MPDHRTRTPHPVKGPMIVDLVNAQVSPQVHADATALMHQARGVMYAYQDDRDQLLRSIVRDDLGPVYLVRAVVTTADRNRKRRHHRIELEGQHGTPLADGMVRVWCTCPAREHNKLCRHVIATWRRTLADHQQLTEAVSA